MKNNAYKKLLVAVFAMCVATGAFAQDPIEKGAWLFSGGTNLGYNSISSSGGGASVSLFNFDTKGGYFFVDNLAAGILVNYTSISGGGSDVSSTAIGLFARYYLQGKFFLGAGFQSLSTSSGGTSGPSTTQIPFEAGYAMFFGKAVAVEPGLSFTTYDGGSTFGVRIGFSVYLGRGD
jgi:hypothetical protein